MAIKIGHLARPNGVRINIIKIILKNEKLFNN
jgi:hypothetical protein